MNKRRISQFWFVISAFRSPFDTVAIVLSRRTSAAFETSAIQSSAEYVECGTNQQLDSLYFFAGIQRCGSGVVRGYLQKLGAYALRPVQKRALSSGEREDLHETGRPRART